MGCVGSFGLGFMMPGMAYCMSSIIAVLYNPDPAHIQSEVQMDSLHSSLSPSPRLSEVPMLDMTGTKNAAELIELLNVHPPEGSYIETSNIAAVLCHSHASACLVHFCLAF